MLRVISAVCLAASLAAAGTVWAQTIGGRAPMDTDRLMGRWYEILRAPNKVQRNCFAAYQVWSRKGDDYAVQQVCHRDRPDGRVAEVTAAAKALNPQNTLFETTFFGGLIRQKYVLADHAPDYSWLISITADGRFPKLLSRSPAMSAAQQETIKQHMAQLGIDVSHMEFCGDSPG